MSATGGGFLPAYYMLVGIMHGSDIRTLPCLALSTSCCALHWQRACWAASTIYTFAGHKVDKPTYHHWFACLQEPQTQQTCSLQSQPLADLAGLFESQKDDIDPFTLYGTNL